MKVTTLLKKYKTKLQAYKMHQICTIDLPDRYRANEIRRLMDHAAQQIKNNDSTKP